MKDAYLVLDFSVWYYTRAFRDILAVWMNFMWFILHFFSIPLLLRTLFSPWRRMTDSDKRTSIEDFMEAFVMNIMTRIFGAIVRLSIILCGILFLLLGVIALFAVIALWVCLPVLLIMALSTGVTLLVS